MWTAVGALALAGGLTSSATAAPGQPDVRLKVLVLDDGSPMVAAIASRLTQEGMPIEKVDLSGERATIDQGFLAVTDGSGAHGNYSGVVKPSDAPAQLSAAELGALATYEAAFGVREVSAYNYANPSIGLNVPAYAGQVDGLSATVTPAAKAAGFGYLNGTLTLDDVSPSVPESYGYLATPLTPDPNGGTFTPLVTAAVPGTGTTGTLMGQYTQGGRERLVLTFASSGGQQHWRVLSHGVVSWLTKGISLSYNRNYFSAHVDDVLLPDALWSPENNCTAGDTGCPASADDPKNNVRMTGSDALALRDWQRRQAIKLDVAFNGAGKDQYLASTRAWIDPLADALFWNSSQYRFINHTWSHDFLGCTRNETTVPWTCEKDAAGNTRYYSRAGIEDQIRRNNSFASWNFYGNYNSSELITGEHSGLKITPQQPDDNPNLGPALASQRIAWAASDASRDPNPRPLNTSGTMTVPRYPMNIYYNVATKAQEVDEYNWIYTARADGGSGLCEDNPAIMTCIAPLDPATGFDSYIKPMEARIALSHVLNDDARPHYVHQSNLAGERILYPVLEETLTQYRALFASNTPVVNPSLREAGAQLVNQQKWAQASGQIDARIVGNRLVVRNTGGAAVSVPVTAPNGTISGRTIFGGTPYGSAYAGERSAWNTLGAGQSLTLTLPTTAGYTSPATWPQPVADAPAPAARVARTPVQENPAREVRLPEANTELIQRVVPGE